MLQGQTLLSADTKYGKLCPYCPQPPPPSKLTYLLLTCLQRDISCIDTAYNCFYAPSVWYSYYSLNICTQYFPFSSCDGKSPEKEVKISVKIFFPLNQSKSNHFPKLNMTCIKNAIYKVFDKLCLHFTSQNNMALGGMQS